jgi:predicted esterase
MRLAAFVVASMLTTVPASAAPFFGNEHLPVPPLPGPVLRLVVPGKPQAFYVVPRSDDQGGGGERRIVLVLHARHGDPASECAKWAEVAAPFGWVLCPGGPFGEDGDRSWSSISLDDNKTVIDAAVDTLRASFPGRVRAADNLLIGFSEGAMIAQTLGLREPERWSRWLILAGSDHYWGVSTEQAYDVIRRQARKIARVVMLTGEFDDVRQHTIFAGAMLRVSDVPVRVIIPFGLGHEVPADRMVATYQAPLRWLVEPP